MTTSPFFVPSWPQPNNVHSLVTTRLGGLSVSPYDSMNLGSHVGDVLEHVDANRRLLSKYVKGDMAWLEQVHGTDVVCLDAPQGGGLPQADAAFTSKPGKVCAVLTADCIPILLCSRTGDRVAAVHAGWRGLSMGVVDAAVKALTPEPSTLMAYIGPCISREYFEVEIDVIEEFERQGWDQVDQHYVVDKLRPGKFYMDLVSLARSRLVELGITNIHGEGYCTYANEHFYSHRRDGKTGRFASLIWLGPLTSS